MYQLSLFQHIIACFILLFSGREKENVKHFINSVIILIRLFLRATSRSADQLGKTREKIEREMRDDLAH